MVPTTSKPEYDAMHAVKNYDWASLGAVTVVDVGGAFGHIAVELVQNFDNLSVIVQDRYSQCNRRGKRPSEVARRAERATELPGS